jgi:hypothetical protein
MKEKAVTIPKEKLLTYVCIYTCRYAEPKSDGLEGVERNGRRGCPLNKSVHTNLHQQVYCFS